jgi:hypothetical protein
MADITVDIQSTTVAIEMAVGAQGPQGDPGAPGGSTVSYTAGENLSAGRVVIIDADEAFHFQPSLSAHQGRAYGVTTAAATIGNTASIQLSGEITNGSFAFTADRLTFVDTNGAIVDTYPSTLIAQSAGVASDAGTMRIDFSISVLTT